jgi:hypothetical protein
MFFSKLSLKILCGSILFTIFSCSQNEKKESNASKSVLEKNEKIVIQKNPNKNLYWGDTHLHTANSPDAFAGGNRLTPSDAYRFAKGQEITSSSGVKAQLSRPLDFLVVADHAEGFGIGQEILNGNPTLLKDPIIRRWKKMFEGTIEESIRAGKEMPKAVATGSLSKEVTAPEFMGPLLMKVWKSYIHQAEQHYQPGVFTSLIGYEWSSMPGGNNIHRVVIYRDGAQKAGQILPFSAFQSNNPEDLWKALQKYEDKTNGKILAIPHNGNLSNGRMFSLADFNNHPMTKAYADIRSSWEPLVETTQFKGDSESHPILSPNDEFSSFGDAGWELGNMTLSELKTNEMLAKEYSRGALKNGLMMKEKIGANPFKFGMIGATDSHTGMSTADDNNWLGKVAAQENNPKRALGTGRHFSGKKMRKDWQYLSSGYAAVWSESNTREDLWDAMKRKEVYGTTGPRIQLRFFGGWDFQSDDVKKGNYVALGYKKGVPMGSDLTFAPKKKSPTFMIVATKDSEGANLDRVQVIKGWTKAGKTYEKIYNVGWSDDRRLTADGKLPPVGNTVDVKTATFTNDIGTKEIAIVWADPQFDASQHAFYYVRVLEIPTPRWSTYDAAKHNFSLPAGIPLHAQERAYSSPIWYTPN